MEERALNLGMTSSYLKTSIFVRPHEYDESPFSKISTLESVFENLRFRYPRKRRLRVDGSRIRRKKVPVFENTWLRVDGVLSSDQVPEDKIHLV